jgi:phosphoglycolate phosphatase-like HAD superfamily hydrolase
LAAERAESLLGFEAHNTRRWHFGDTPNDMKAAEFAGATAVGLLTGIFSRDELANSSEAAEPIILDDLSDTSAVFAALGLH